MKKTIAMLLALWMFGPAAGAADDISSAASGLCEKVRSCAMAQVAQEDLTPELRQMMEPMLDSMCANMQQKVQEVPSGHPLYQPAVECMRSMEALSCEAMQNGDNLQTAACQEYEELAKEHGGL